MPLSPETLQTLRRLNSVAHDLKLLFAGRDTAVDLMRLALLCREHVLLLGPPGTGKSELVSRFARGVDAQLFQYLLTRFTEPTELFGPVDMKAFQQSTYRINTEGRLPKAQIAFLDEVFQASSAILNTLLNLVHERIFDDGSGPAAVPLMTLFGASNQLPDDPTLQAFSDRFVLRLEVEPVGDDALGDLLERGWSMERQRLADQGPAGGQRLTPAQLDTLYRQLPEIGIGAVQDQYVEILRRLRAEGVEMSDRRMVKGLKLIRGAAMLDGQDQADARHLWPINHMWSNPDDRAAMREVVQPVVDEAGGPALASHRSLSDLREEIELLEGRAAELRGDGAYTAYLSALGQIRRELMTYHPGATAQLEQVQGLIRQALEAMRAGL